jgi:hypothetical protein
MDIFFEILKYILPALVVLGATYVVLSKQLAGKIYFKISKKISIIKAVNVKIKQ